MKGLVFLRVIILLKVSVCFDVINMADNLYICHSFKRLAHGCGKGTLLKANKNCI